ncbi:hypothetical protein PMAYCL1PPCAC_16421, partial [Pristionchus mayeri]
VNASVAAVTVLVYGAFGFMCGGHISLAMRRHIRKSSQQGMQVTITVAQTRQSLIQIGIFCIFLAFPLVMMILPTFLDASEDLLRPYIIVLLSLNSMVHSLTLIASTPPFRKYIRKNVCRKG